jgi:GNAT superfamily N-acetyltransferase
LSPDPIDIRQLGLDEVTPALGALERLYRGAFHNSHMYEGLLEDLSEAPEIFRLFVAVPADSPEQIIGARVIETKSHPDFEYLGCPPVHGKRFCVTPSARGRGVGRGIVTAGKRYCFDELKVSALFGESNEIGALAMHGREGAMFSLESIRQISRRNGPEENLRFFQRFLADPAFRSYRYPVGPGVRFVYCRDPHASRRFEAAGFASASDLENTKVHLLR